MRDRDAITHPLMVLVGHQWGVYRISILDGWNCKNMKSLTEERKIQKRAGTIRISRQFSRMQLSSRAKVIATTVDKDTYKSHEVTIQRLIMAFYQQLIPLFIVKHESRQ